MKKEKKKKDDSKDEGNKTFFIFFYLHFLRLHYHIAWPLQGAQAKQSNLEQAPYKSQIPT